MKRKEDYRRVLGDFKAGKTDILVGTQMIAKGLHFENVTLVGVVNAAKITIVTPDQFRFAVSISALAAVVLGGTSIFGGRGSGTGTLLGVAAIAMLAIGIVSAQLLVKPKTQL